MGGVESFLGHHVWIAEIFLVVLAIGFVRHVGLKNLSIFLFCFVLPLGLIAGSAYLLQKPRQFALGSKDCAAVRNTLSAVNDYGGTDSSIVPERAIGKIRKGDPIGLEGYWSTECAARATGSWHGLELNIVAVDFGTHSFASKETFSIGRRYPAPRNAPGTSRVLSLGTSGSSVLVDYQFVVGRLWISAQLVFADPEGHTTTEAFSRIVEVSRGITHHVPATPNLDVDSRFRAHLAAVWAWWIAVLALVPLLLAPFLAGSRLTAWRLLVVLDLVVRRFQKDPTDPVPGSALVRKVRLLRWARAAGALSAAATWGAGTYALLRVIPADVPVLAAAAIIGAAFWPIEVARTVLLGATRRYRYLRPNSVSEWRRVIALAFLDSVFVAGVMYAGYTLANAWMLVPRVTQDNGGSISALVFAVFLGPVVFILMSALLRAFRPLRRRSAEQVMANDEREQVLYLRSFGDDRASMPTRVTLFNPLSFVFDWDRVESNEEYLARMLWRFGPVLAVGRPGEQHAPLGAARLYYPNDAWQAAVATLIRSSALVVLTMGSSSGITWELQQLRELGALGKTIVVIPPARGDQTRIALLAHEVEVEDIWTSVSSPLIPCVFWFDLTGQPHAVWVDVLDDAAYDIGISEAVRRIDAERGSLESMLQG